MPPALKVAVPLAVLVGGVFALTYFAIHAPTDPGGGPGVKGFEPVEGGGDPPLRFFTTSRQWDPDSPSLPDRAFPGYYEVGERLKAGDRPPVGSAFFWFENRNPEEVTLQLKAVSCSACSGGRVGVIPPDVTRQILQTAFGTAALPMGLATGLAAPGLAGPAAHLDPARPTVTWQAYQFRDFAQDLSRVRYKVPGSADPDGWARQWGVLEVNFEVKANPALPLTADFVSRVGTTDRLGANKFSLVYTPVTPMEVDQAKIEVPDLTAGSGERRAEFHVFSFTRPDLPPPALRVDLPTGAVGEPGGWVTAGPPAKLDPGELAAFAAGLSARAKGEPVRVVAAYRVPVVVRARDGDRPADIGKLDRVVGVAVGDESRPVRVTAAVRGPVYLSGEGKEIGLGSFRASAGASATAYLTTERADTTLAWVKDETTPKYLKVELKKQSPRGDLGGYEVRVTVPKNEQPGELVGEVVLEADGPVRQRVRLPVSGRAENR